MGKINEMEVKFLSLSENEVFARTVVSAFILPLNPSLSELNDIKTAISEAVTNAVVHAYPDTAGYVYLSAKTEDNTLYIKISDKGVGIENLDKALEPFYTSKPEDERSGMGFTIMKMFMEDVKVVSKLNGGTDIYMQKTITSE